MPRAVPISWCVYPSTSCIRNTVRYPSGSPSIASASRSLRSGSASRLGVATGSARARSPFRVPSQPAVAHHAVDQPIDPIHVRVIQLAFCIRVARQDTGDEIRWLQPRLEVEMDDRILPVGTVKRQKGLLDS